MLAMTATFIAGCAAFFSVRGISLLFAGSMIPVAIMASSLEVGKLMAASFLYRQWKRLKLLMKFYLSVAVVLLIGITSLGVYGYLSDAFDKTMSQVKLYETNIEQTQKQIDTYQKEINKIEGAADLIDTKANESITQYQKIYDDFVADQRARQQALRDQLKMLNEAVAVVENQPGGLFSNKKKKLQELKDQQAEDRNTISNSLKEIDVSISDEYKKFTVKVERLRESTEQVPDNVQDVNTIYDKIRGKELEILKLREDIRNTDIGSFKFIARSFDMELEQVVKWFIFIICVVFDPLAVVLVVGLNMMIADRWQQLEKPVATEHKKKVAQPTENQPIVTTISPTTTTPNKVHVKYYTDTDIMESQTTVTQPVSVIQVEKIVEVEKPVEVEKIVEVEKPVEVEKIVEVEKPIESKLSPADALKMYWKQRQDKK